MVNRININTINLNGDTSGSGAKNAYAWINQLDDYLYEVQFTNLDYEYANKYLKPQGGCTGVYKSGRVLRNMDWNYNNEVEFLVRRIGEPEKGIYSSIGVACCMPYLTKEVVDSGAYVEKFKMVPFATGDGVNEKGIFVQTNVVVKNFNVNINDTEGAIDCCITTLPRYILDHLDSLANLQTLLNSLHIYSTDKISYCSHLLVADSSSSKVIEFNANSYEIIDSPIMTNFRLNGGFSFDPTTYLPNWDTIEPYGLGVERWEIAANGLTNNTSLEDLRSALFYTNTYKTLTNPQWLTEATGNTEEFGNLTVQLAHSEPSAFSEIMAHYRDLYDNRSRDTGETWHTEHSCIYDIAAKSVNICIQERNTSKTYYLDASSSSVDIIDNLTSERTDAALSAKQGKVLNESTVKTVNGTAPVNGNVNIATFSAVPSTMDSYKSGTLEDYCKAFLTTVNPTQGSAYLTSGIAFTNLPKSFSDHGNPSCEMFIYVPMRSGNNVVFNLEITTTNCFEEQWYGGPGKWMAICQVENGAATLHMPWRGMLGCPQSDTTTEGKHKYIPTEDYHAVSKYWLDTRLASLDACKFVSMWNSSTGLPATTITTPYTYKTGSYYIVSTVSRLGYSHAVHMEGSVSGFESRTYSVDFTVETTSSTPMSNFSDITSFLLNNGYTGRTSLPATGTIDMGESTLPISGISYDTEGGYIMFNREDTSTIGQTLSATTLSDTVTQTGTGINYKPDGATYTGTASTAEESNAIEVGAVYYYNGTAWCLQAVIDNLTTDGSTIALSAKQGKVLNDAKADKVSGTHTNEIVTLDSGGNVQASGKTVADVTDIIYGYMHEGAFYEDSAHTTAITPTANKQYMDMTAPSTPAPYVYNGSAYVSIGGGDTSTLEEVAAEALTDLDYRLRKVINGHIKDGKEKILTDANFKPVNNLTTVAAVQPLSASQGKYLKDLSDTNEEILAWALTELALVKSAVNNIAREYSPSTAYNVDEYCIHDGLLFRCTTATSASVSFDPSKWTQTNVMDELIRLTSN